MRAIQPSSRLATGHKTLPCNASTARLDALLNRARVSPEERNFRVSAQHSGCSVEILAHLHHDEVLHAACRIAARVA
ncbi:hypothetical protein KM317_05425 [Xanthomonas translucens pv. arrhenatheri]|uniref:hypothetical protein n=1 Tax=Xanthomonas graminis TaxID=3390026 RepID=UPI001F28CEFE|nr:hypothetical protein [Xanthomonas translucens]UKE78671.1 hypothetical protein KM317_05425 [Xanthomonas translucens pv. arrhenatheri]